MYKIKIINYKPYEYELLQEQLDQLGKEGFECKDLSFLSFFKKVDHPVSYKIDFFKQTGETPEEKMGYKEEFLYPYEEHDYIPIYNKKGMYVFMGKEDATIQQRLPSFITDKFAIKYLGYFIGVVFFVAFLANLAKINITIDSFLSYGMTLAFIGAIGLCLSFLYRSFMNYVLMMKLYQCSENNKSIREEMTLTRYRFLYKILFCISAFLIIGGVTEDIFNAKPFLVEEHPILRLSDLSIDEDSDLTLKRQQSFTIPNTFITLEVSDNDTVLYSKDYEFSSQKRADKFYQDVLDNPSDHLLTSAYEKENVIYGYTEKDLTTLYIKKENRVILVSVTFSLSQDQIDTILNHYY